MGRGLVPCSGGQLSMTSMFVNYLRQNIDSSSLFAPLKLFRSKNAVFKILFLFIGQE